MDATMLDLTLMPMTLMPLFQMAFSLTLRLCLKKFK